MRKSIIISALCVAGVFLSSQAHAIAPATGSTAPISNLLIKNTNVSHFGQNLDTLARIQQDIDGGQYHRRCREDEHDPNRYHRLVDPEKRCHHTHSHGDNPHTVNDIFGTPGDWFSQSGHSISYPWSELQQPVEAQQTHADYFWVVRRNQPCGTFTSPLSAGQCITDFRIQYHGRFDASSKERKFQSFSLEMRVCEDADDYTSCSLVRKGGWTDRDPLQAVAPIESAESDTCRMDMLGNVDNTPAHQFMQTYHLTQVSVSQMPVNTLFYNSFSEKTYLHRPVVAEQVPIDDTQNIVSDSLQPVDAATPPMVLYDTLTNPVPQPRSSGAIYATIVPESILPPLMATEDFATDEMIIIEEYQEDREVVCGSAVPRLNIPNCRGPTAPNHYAFFD